MFFSLLFLYILYAYIAISVTKSIASVYILISPAYTRFIGKKNTKNENISPTFSPKSFLICVKPIIPNIESTKTENSLYRII